MKKAFISQPMKDKTEDQIRHERKAAILYLDGKGYEVVDSVFTDFPTFLKGNAPLKHLAKAIDLIADVDLVYFMNGWDNARGCRIEHSVCLDYGIAVMYEPGAAT
jgi:hypothetical protein